jgi:hypothetical protein
MLKSSPATASTAVLGSLPDVLYMKALLTAIEEVMEIDMRVSNMVLGLCFFVMKTMTLCEYSWGRCLSFSGNNSKKVVEVL